MRTNTSTSTVLTMIATSILILGLLQGCAGVLVAAGASAAAAAVDRRTAGTILEDEAIELKIRNGIYQDKELENKIHINVTSYNNVVLLSGEAPTTEMRDLAVNRAREVEKVKRVYNEIQLSPVSSLKARSTDTWITSKIKTALVGTQDINTVHVKVITENRTVYLMGLLSKEEGDIAGNVASSVGGVQGVMKLFEFID